MSKIWLFNNGIPDQCNNIKDAGFIYESFQNESSNLEFLILRNESTKRIFGKQAYEMNPQYESLENRPTKRIHDTNL